ncbi:WPP domain-associated protein-like isoform X4 [Dioscorea cayenensis subsp. rotundata]|uniref:WPP domain-associated protein-like isoform X4 n=1 Tax=Dioscorea cayennensis subsp. rotundata TaxID=55577 RepID=A0AB40CHN4_DIOCR|nr:WPP domain-associated protein-like isoform X4 [Dioscorea cayenensis subsp. rotundata]
MDEFFDGLDCRLRVSGMVADSIMLGIVNSAMETAFEKSCSKEGDLERLNEKSRFCELAIMQLEWCLKYVQEEMDSYIVESCREREKLLSELLETRDRLHNRLQETELVIAQMDGELIKMKSNDLRLRLALEMKDDELRSLQAALDLERTINVRGHSFHPCHTYTSKDIRPFDELSELRTSTERHLQRIRGKLEDGQQHLTDLLRKFSLSLSDIKKPSYSFNVREKGLTSDACKLLLQENGVVDLERAMPEYCHRRLMRKLNRELGEIAVDINMLNKKLDHSFEMMGRSMFLLKTALDEQQLEYNIEKEAFEVIVRNFILDLQCDSGKNAATKNFAAVVPDESWSAFMGEIKKLHSELELLINLKDTKSKVHGGFDVRLSPSPTSGICTAIKDKPDCEKTLQGSSCGLPKPADDSDCVADNNGTLHDVFTQAHELVSEENLSKENNSGQSVAAIVRSHEQRIIRQKSEELKWPKVELTREKLTSTHKDKDLDSVQKLISSVISRLQIIMKENVKLVAGSDACMPGYGGEMNSIQDDYISQPESLEKGSKITETTSEIPVELGGQGCCHASSGVCCDDVRNIKQEKNDWDFEVMILEEIYAILFVGLLNRLHLEFFNCDSETFITEDTQLTIFKEIIKECSLYRETCCIERLVSAAVDHIVFSEIVKDIKCTIRSAFRDIHGKVVPASDYLTDGLIIHDKKVVPSLEFVFLSKNSKIPEECSELMEYPIPNSPVVIEDNVLSQINQELGRGTQKKVHGNRQLHELSSSSVLLDNIQGIHDQTTSTGAFIQREFSQFKPKIFGESMPEELQSSLLPFLKLSQLITDLELIASEKIRKNTSRLVDLNCQLNCLSDEIMSIKKKELLYKTAFTRRCYDLQIAEVEVDLLGDEVDLLVGLLEKIYVALDHYSPVLHNYFGDFILVLTIFASR